MVPYYVLLGVVSVLGFVLCELKKSRRRDLIYVCICTVLMLLMAGLRSGKVGVDYGAYANYFIKVTREDFSYALSMSHGFPLEPGYRLLNYLISLITSNVYIFMAIISAVIIVPRMVFVYKYCKSTWLGVFVYVSFGFFGYAMCTLRQELGITVAMFAIPFLQNKKPLPFFLIVALSGMFHSSMWIFLPFYFIAWIPVNWKSLAVYVSGTVFVLIFSEVILNFITDYIYTGYKPGSMFTEGRSLNTAFIPILLFLCALLMKKRLLEYDPRNVILLNFSCYAALLFVLTIKHFIFQRVALIFLPAAILLIPQMLASVDVDMSQYALLEQEAPDPSKKKQFLGKQAELKRRLKDEKNFYYMTMGFILFGGLIYFAFLQYANRLLLVPYQLFF